MRERIRGAVRLKPGGSAFEFGFMITGIVLVILAATVVIGSQMNIRFSNSVTSVSVEK